LLPPNDFGMDIACFSNVPSSQWKFDGHCTETRTIIFRSGETVLPAGQPVRAESRLFLSGALILLGTAPGADLTGAKLTMDITITQNRPNLSPVVVLSGGAVITGGPNGAANVGGTGFINAANHPLADLRGLIQNIPVVQAVVFNGLLGDQFPYTYETAVDEPFDLVLDVRVQGDTPPNGVGASAILGLPQANLSTVLQRTKLDDAAAQLADQIAARVDTSGSTLPVPESVVTPIPLLALLPRLCGVTGLESVGLLCAMGTWAALGARRRRQR
jgi:hypothetical protein